MHVSKKRKSPSGPVEDKTALRARARVCVCVCVCVCAFCLLLQRACSKCPDAHVYADLELWWSYVFLNVVLYFIKSFFSIVKTQRPGSDCAVAHACTC